MKKSYIIFIWTAAFAYINAQWVMQYPIKAGDNIRSVKMTSSLTAWTVSNTEVLKSSDAGETWSINNTGSPGPFVDISFSTENDGVLLDSYGSILKTSNGGNSWTKIYNGTLGSDYSSIQYIDINNIVTLHGEMVLRTTNGGVNWATQSLNIDTLYPYIKKIYFANNSIGVIVGRVMNEEGLDVMGFIRSTTNGGLSWFKPQVEVDGLFNDVIMVDSNRGFLIAEGGSIQETTNGGLNWNHKITYSGYPQSIAFSDNLNGIIVGKNGFILTTSNGGDNWEGYYAGSTDDINSVSCFNNNAVAGGAEGYIITSTNKGIDWTTRTRHSKDLKSVDFYNSNNGFVVGYSGNILRTSNGGNTWSQINSGTFKNLHDIFFVDANIAFIAGNAGTILKSTNGGISWSAQTSSTTRDLYKIFFTNQLNGFAAGGNIILRTSNGGASWSNYINLAYNLTGLFFIDDNIGFACGYNGLILKTTNGGISWSQQQSNTTGTLSDIFFVSPTIGYAAESSLMGKVHKTTDGGNSWTQISTTNYPNNAMHFIDAEKGVIVGESGTISKTTNGGVSWSNWSNQAVGTTTRLFSVVIKDLNTAYVVGLGGTILKNSNLGFNITPPAEPNLISYWKLDELSGNTYADYTGVNNGTGNVSPVSVTGRVGQAQQFNGSNTRIDVPAHPSLDFLAGDNFSVEFWYKGSNVPSGYKMVTGRHVNSSNRWYIGFKSNSRIIRFTMTSNGETFNINGSNIINGNWHHVAVTRNGTTGATKVYVDGNLSGSFTKVVTGNISSSSVNLNIGNYAGNYVLDGALDELAIHKSELSAAIVQEHYNNGLTGKGYYDESPTSSAPVITSTPGTEASIGQLYTYDVNASGSPSPTFSLLTSPAGMVINSSTGVIQWTPANPGNFNVTVEAQNGVSPAAEQSFIINVPDDETEIPAGLVAYWKLDELSGNTYADFTGVNNGTGNVSPISVTGRVGQAQQFNGTNTRIDVPANPSLDFAAADDFTVELWFKGSTVPSTYQIITGRHINSSNRWYIGFKSNNPNIRFTMTSNGENFDMYGTNIINNNWHHVAVTRKGSTGVTKIYVDGVLNTTYTKVNTGNISSPSANLNIGNYAGNYMLGGIVDELAIHKQELSQTVIQEHYNKGLAGQPYYTLGKPNTIAQTQIPEQFLLEQNFPNPFNPSTMIRYQLPEDSKVSISIYNITGELVAQLADEIQQTGFHQIQWQADNLASGMYLLRISAQALRKEENYIKTLKMMLLK